jgi:hypothetical protein
VTRYLFTDEQRRQGAKTRSENARKREAEASIFDDAHYSAKLRRLAELALLDKLRAEAAQPERYPHE